jgi:hypothetical protein
MKVALLDHAENADPAARAVDRILVRRGFTPGLAHVPGTVLRLRRGAFDLAHAFTAPDAVAGLMWGGPVVFTCTEVLRRDNVANSRLRLHTFERALTESDAVLAADERVAESMWRWLAVEAPVLDTAGHDRLYGELLAQRG